MSADRNLDIFASIWGAADDTDLEKLMDLASGLSDTDKTHLLEAASGAGENLDSFIRQAQTYAADSQRSLSDYLDVAADANDRLEILIETAGSLDLAAVSQFSAVDTVNFLDAAQRHPGAIGDLTQTGQELSGTDRSYFLYAAANTSQGMGELLEKTRSLSQEALSDYLLTRANEGQDDTDRSIFMTALLDNQEYADFKSIAQSLDGEQLNTLSRITDELSGEGRSQFLLAGAATGPAADEYVLMFDSLSSKTRTEYPDVTAKLGGDNLENFVRASVNAGSHLGDFISLTDKLITEQEQSVVNGREKPLKNFLSAAAKADPDDLKGFIDFTGQLDGDQRAGFLDVADHSGLDTGDITRLGQKALSLGDRFMDIFGTDNIVAGNTTMSVKDYETLTNAAKSQDEETWHNTRFSMFYRNSPEVTDLWA